MTFFKGRHLSSGKAIKHHHNAQQTTENSLFVIKSLDRGREICLPRSHATSSINNCQMRGCNLVTQEHHHQGLTTLHCLMQVLGTTPRFCLPRSQQCTIPCIYQKSQMLPLYHIQKAIWQNRAKDSKDVQYLKEKLLYFLCFLLFRILTILVILTLSSGFLPK